MGLTIKGNHKTSLELSGGYFMLHKIRFIIAECFDTEFYEHYSTLLEYRNDWKEFNNRTNEILSHERFKNEDEDLIDFFFMSDCDGKISYKTCKKILDLIDGVNKEVQLRYAYFSKNDWNDFKEILKGCYRYKANLVWI